MANATINVNEHDIFLAENAVREIIKGSITTAQPYENYDQLIKSLGLTEVVKRLTDCIACDKAWIRYYQDILHSDLIKHDKS